MTNTNQPTTSGAGNGAGNDGGLFGGPTMSFGDHLEELRRRVFFAIGGVLPIFIIAFAFGRQLVDLLIAPAREQLRAGGQSAALLATGPFETFGTVVHIAVVVTVLIGAPWILYQLWLFIAPGLYAHEKRFVHLLVPFSALLTVVSVVFLYIVILPVVLQFFIAFSNQVGGAPAATVDVPDGIVFPSVPVLEGDPPAPEVGHEWINLDLNQRRVAVGVDDDGAAIVRGTELVSTPGIVQQYRISEYVRMFLNMALAFGIGFQMPVVVVMLGWLGIVRPAELTRYRKHVIAVCAVASAILTPADPLSMVLLAIPLYMLYELGVLILRVLPAERVARGIMNKDDDDHTDDHPDDHTKEPADAGDE